MFRKKLAVLLLTALLLLVIGGCRTTKTPTANWLIYQTESKVFKLSYIDSKPVKEEIQLPEDCTPAWITKEGELVCLTGVKTQEIASSLESGFVEIFEGIKVFDINDTEVRPTSEMSIGKDTVLGTIDRSNGNALVLTDLVQKEWRWEGNLAVLDLEGKLLPVIKDGNPLTHEALYFDEACQFKNGGVIYNDHQTIYMGDIDADKYVVKPILNVDVSNEETYILNTSVLPATNDIVYWTSHPENSTLNLNLYNPTSIKNKVLLTATLWPRGGSFLPAAFPLGSSNQFITYIEGEYQDRDPAYWLIDPETNTFSYLCTELAIINSDGTQLLCNNGNWRERAHYTSYMKFTDNTLQKVDDLPGWVDFACIIDNGKSVLLVDMGNYSYASDKQPTDTIYIYDVVNRHIHLVDEDVRKVIW